MKHSRHVLAPLSVLLALLLLWQVYASSELITSRFLPTPVDVARTLFNFRDVLWQNLLPTLYETVTGLVLAVLIGVATAVLIFWSEKFRRAVYPLIVMSQTIPFIALAPLLLFWFGFGSLPKVLIVILFCFFPITVAVSDGFLSTPKHLDDLFKSWGASRWQSLRYLHTPAALDSFFAGLKISTTYAVTGAIVGEYVGGFQGLGIYMQTAAHANAIAVVFAAIVVVVVMTLLLLAGVFALHRLATPWKRYHG